MPRTGRIEQASRGTLFLDDIERLPEPMQRKLHRVLDRGEVVPLGSDQARAVDLRVVAASNVDLAAQVRGGAFSASLFYRLNGITLRLPPLRERREDIALLFAVFCSRIAARTGRAEPQLSGAVWHRLNSHEWPGNVRELQHYAEQVMLGLDHDPENTASGGESIPLKDQVAAFEKAVISYRSDHGRLPQSLDALVPASVDSVPLDPWGHAFGYTRQAAEVHVWCYGKNGRPHGQRRCPAA